MVIKHAFLLVLLFGTGNLLSAQAPNATFSSIKIEGYAFEEGNRGFLNEVNIAIVDGKTKTPVAQLTTNSAGFFTCDLPAGQEFLLRASKDIFAHFETTISTQDKKSGEKVFVEVRMKRKPGYVFELTLAEERKDTMAANAVTDARIEVYNRTTDKQIMDINPHPKPVFKFLLEQGNHYTFLIRKKGYFNKKIEAFVNVQGCILCIDGVKKLEPGVADNLTAGFEMGTLLANLEMQRAELNRTMVIDNIYYDYDKSHIRTDAARELDKLVSFLKENPILLVELGSHTDSRGKDDYNMDLSQKRAQSAVDYIVKRGSIKGNRIKAKGYGESKLVNQCVNGTNCNEEEHQRNRRTELKVIGFSDVDPMENNTLADIVRLEKQEKLLQEVLNSEVVEIKPGEALPADLKAQLEAQSKQEKSPALPPAIVPTVPVNFTGFKIQVLDQESPLMEGDPVFSQLKSITMEIQEGRFYYLFGEFVKKEDAQSYVENILSGRYPQAKIVQFEAGKRK